MNFKYDPFGRRIQKSGPLGTTNYLYESVNVLEELDSSGNVLARYTQGANIDEPLVMLRGGTSSYYEQDGLGSVTSLSSSGGSLANTYTYDSFGKLTASSGTITNPFQYAGREFDAETGLYEYRARYYDQNVGRFISEDSIQFEGGLNFYRYVGNSATNRNDPDGLGVVECLKALDKWARAYATVQQRLGLFNNIGDADPGHAASLQQALNRLNNAAEEVKKKCDCDLKAKAVAVAAATAALAARVADALSQFSETCAEDLELCLAPLGVAAAF